MVDSKAIPSVQTLQNAAKSLVRKAVKSHTTQSLTPRIIRQKLEKQFSLRAGTLDASEYKTSLKLAIEEALNDEDSDGHESGSSEEVVQASSSATKNPKSKSKQKEVKDISTNTKKEKTMTKRKSNDGDSTKPARKVSQANGSPPTPKRALNNATKEYKSLEHVPSSDAEMGDAGIQQSAGPETKVTRKERPLAKNAEKQTKEDIPEEGTNQQAIKLQKIATEDKSSNNGNSKSPEDDQSESELSVLIDDEPPKKKRKAPTKGKTEKTERKTKAKTTAKSDATLSKDEQQIKRLKALIVACGVRKVWSRILPSDATHKAHIATLKDILRSLGMSDAPGMRMSMEHARAIKAKREMEQELADVQQFEKSLLARSGGRQNDDDDDGKKDSEQDEDEEEEFVKPAKKARRSVMQFLQDQSDDE